MNKKLDIQALLVAEYLDVLAITETFSVVRFWTMSWWVAITPSLDGTRIDMEEV